MPIDAERLNKLVKHELAGLSDTRVIEHINALLVSPKLVLRDWDYGTPGQQYPCWVVLDDVGYSDTTIGYCEFGFGPRCPWGLLYFGEESKHQSMGMDSAWFPTFLEAFFESRAATRLPIWKGFKITLDGARTAMTDEGPWEDSWKRIEELRNSDPTGDYRCDHSVTYGR
jgi:hypothetical protein